MPVSEQAVRELFDEAAVGAPRMHVDSRQVLAGGRARVRGRKVRAVAGGVVAAVFVAVAWLGLVGGASDLFSAEVIPAAPQPWTTDEDVEVTLAGPDVPGLMDQPLIVLGRAAGSEHFTVSVEGHDPPGGTLPRTVLPGGVEVFAGDGLSLVVFTYPEGRGVQAEVLSRGSIEARSAPGPEIGGHRVGWELFGHPDAELEVEDVVFHRDRTVWTASGQPVAQVALEHHGVSVQMVSLPTLDRFGALAGGELSLNEAHSPPVASHGASVSRPWWRGGGSTSYVVLLLPGDVTDVTRPGADPGAEPPAVAPLGEWVAVLVGYDQDEWPEMGAIEWVDGQGRRHITLEE